MTYRSIPTLVFSFDPLLITLASRPVLLRTPLIPSLRVSRQTSLCLRHLPMTTSRLSSFPSLHSQTSGALLLGSQQRKAPHPRRIKRIFTSSGFGPRERLVTFTLKSRRSLPRLRPHNLR